MMLIDPGETCEWVEGRDGEYWDTSCGQTFCFIADGPDENGIKFCCYCGKPLTTKAFIDTIEDEDDDDQGVASEGKGE